MLNNLNFHPFEVVARYRDPQLQMGENYAYWFNSRPFANFDVEAYNAAALIRTIFPSFAAGIANAISSSKWRKIIIFMWKVYVFKMYLLA